MSKRFPLLIALVVLLGALSASPAVAHDAHRSTASTAAHGERPNVDSRYASAQRDPRYASMQRDPRETLGTLISDMRAIVDVQPADVRDDETSLAAGSGCPSHEGGLCCCGSDRITPPPPLAFIDGGDPRTAVPHPPNAERVASGSHLIAARNACAFGPLGSRAPPGRLASFVSV